MTKRLIKSRIKSGAVTISGLLENYFENYVEDEEIKGWLVSLQNAKHLEAFFGEKTIREITPFDLIKYKTQRRKKVKNSTIRREFSVLQSAINRGIDYGLITKQIDKDHIENLKFSKQKPKAKARNVMPGLGEVETILNNLPPHIRDLMFAVHKLAYRKGELFTLTFADIKFEERLLILPDSKNDSGRSTPLYPEIYEHFEKMHENAKQSLQRDNVNDVPVFREKDGIRPLLAHNVYRPWRNQNVTLTIKADKQQTREEKYLSENYITQVNIARKYLENNTND